jgi:hypothetical protein
MKQLLGKYKIIMALIIIELFALFQTENPIILLIFAFVFLLDFLINSLYVKNHEADEVHLINNLLSKSRSETIKLVVIFSLFILNLSSYTIFLYK